MSSDAPQDPIYDKSGLETLLQLGFPQDVAIDALARHSSIDTAIDWIIQGADPQITSPEDLSMKMVLVVRTDLNMSAGKISAQCVHAALGAYRIASSSNPALVAVWEDSGEKAVCLKCKGEAEIHELQDAATRLGVVSYLVADAGRTQIAAGSETVLAVGPGPEKLINQITGHLKLY
jgi:peptidyl-tRNA hydrolase, PTH2 family